MIKCARIYSLSEVKGFLTIYGGNHAIHGVGAGNAVTRAQHGAYAHIHGGANPSELQARVNTPGLPRKSGTWWNQDDQARATLKLLNSPAG